MRGFASMDTRSVARGLSCNLQYEARRRLGWSNIGNSSPKVILSRRVAGVILGQPV